MPRFDSLAIVWLLLVAALTGFSDAARPRDQREAPSNPYIVSPPGTSLDDNVRPGARDLGERVFSLRHIYEHGTNRYPKRHRYRDVSKDTPLMVAEEDGSTQSTPNEFRTRAMSSNVQRMADRRRSAIDGILDYAKRHGAAMPLSASGWTVDEIAGPNHTDKETVLSLARMAANAYVEEPWTGDWQDVGGGFNNTDDFGWESDSLRGHIYADKTNETVVIGLKGTSMAVFDGAETTGNDKLNDNLFGSCCCAQNGPWTWKQVCNCMNSTYTCNNTCLVKNLMEKNHYYWAVKDLYHNVTERYPNSQVWLSGHSLGGVVSTLVGLTFGLPVMTFEAFPDALAASRLGLPTPPGYHIGAHQSRTDTAIHHYGHTADPVFMGSCNGATSTCSIGGYAFEGHCHTGKTCIYDTVGDLGWRNSIYSHRITSVIKDVIEKYDAVAECDEDTECTDCVLWKFFESNGTETTTSVSSSSTSSLSRTRTETCKTPGWWGCLDETTTTTTSISSSSTSTCETPGWFGCKDPTTTTTSTSATSSNASPAPTVTTTRPISSTSISSSSSTCETPGWFGCNDPTTTAKPASTSSLPSETSSSTTCTSKEWFGLICVDPSPTSSSSKPSPTHLPTTRRKCVERYWFGWCKESEWVPENPKNDFKM